MKGNRIKTAGPVIRSRSEMELLVGKLASAQLNLDRNILRMDTEIANLRQEYAPVQDALREEIALLLEAAQAWAKANPDEFGKLKSIEFTQATVGFRIGNPTVKTLTGWTWDRVLEKAQASHPDYVRTKAEVNKEKLLADREILGDAELRALGVRIVQGETFYVEPKREELSVPLKEAA